MAYDETEAERVRAALADVAGVTEKRMFGGLAFLVGGNMAVAIGRGGMLVRVDRDKRGTLVLEPGVEPAVMGSREMRGWVEVDETALADDDALTTWVGRGASFAATLPPK